MSLWEGKIQPRAGDSLEGEETPPEASAPQQDLAAPARKTPPVQQNCTSSGPIGTYMLHRLRPEQDVFDEEGGVLAAHLHIPFFSGHGLHDG